MPHANADGAAEDVLVSHVEALERVMSFACMGAVARACSVASGVLVGRWLGMRVPEPAGANARAICAATMERP